MEVNKISNSASTLEYFKTKLYLKTTTSVKHIWDLLVKSATVVFDFTHYRLGTCLNTRAGTIKESFRLLNNLTHTRS